MSGEDAWTRAVQATLDHLDVPRGAYDLVEGVESVRIVGHAAGVIDLRFEPFGGPDRGSLGFGVDSRVEFDGFDDPNVVAVVRAAVDGRIEEELWWRDDVVLRSRALIDGLEFASHQSAIRGSRTGGRRELRAYGGWR